jgi:putative membrane protein
MTSEWLFASLHLLALAVGFAAISWRARMFRMPDLSGDNLKRLFNADTMWGVAALLWLATGIPRAFMGMGKGNEYYLHNHFFHVKSALFILILLLELWPMITLIKWRIATKKGLALDLSRAPTFSNISIVQALLLVLMVFCATAMARGYNF